MRDQETQFNALTPPGYIPENPPLLPPLFSCPSLIDPENLPWVLPGVRVVLANCPISIRPLGRPSTMSLEKEQLLLFPEQSPGAGH